MEEMKEEMKMTTPVESASRELFFKRNEQAAIRTLYELEKEAGAKVEQTAESVLENMSVLVRAQKEEFGSRQCRYVPLAVMRNIWMVKTSGHGRELSEETTYLKDTDTVSATVVLGDGFGGEYKTTRERPVDRSGFDTEIAQILRSKDLIRGTTWSACYASVQANNGYSKVYLDDTENGTDTAVKGETNETAEAPKRKPRQTKKKAEEPVSDALATATAEAASSPIPPVQETSTPAEEKSEAVKEEKPVATPEDTKPAQQETSDAKTAPTWPEKPLRDVTYEQALATTSPFLKWKLSVITGIGEKPGVGNRKNALSYIEKALSRGETFESDDVNAMLTIIMNNEDLKEAYDRRRKELMTA